MSLDRVTMIGNPTAISVAFKIKENISSRDTVEEGISVVGEKHLSADETITAERFIPLNSLSLDDSLKDEISLAAAGVYSELNSQDDVLGFVDSKFAHSSVYRDDEHKWYPMWYELW